MILESIIIGLIAGAISGFVVGIVVGAVIELRKHKPLDTKKRRNIDITLDI